MSKNMPLGGVRVGFADRWVLRLGAALLATAVTHHASAQEQGRTPAAPAAQAQAQRAPAAPAQPNAQPPASGSATPETEGAAPEHSGSASPREAALSLPPVSDSMLTPPAEPKRQLKDWREAVRLASTRSPNLAIAKAQVEQSAARSRQALGGALPTLTATGTLSRHLLLGDGISFNSATGVDTDATIPDPATRWAARLNLRQPLLALKSWHDIETSKQATRAALLSAKDTQRQILAAVADTIVNVITSQRLGEVSRINLQSALSTLDLTRRRARLGAASALDVLRIEQEVTISRAQVVQANEAIARAREALGVALGYAEPWGVSSAVDLTGLVPEARKICQPTKRADDRADIMAAQARVQIAERNRDGADLLFAPTLDLVSEFAITQSRLSPNGDPAQWTVGGVLTVPLYDGGVRYGVQDETQSAIDQARAEFTLAKRQALVEIQQARRSVNVARSNLDVSRRSRELARETARLASLSFLHGTGTSFDVVETARRKREAEIDYVLKQFEEVQAQILSLLAAANCDLTK